MSTPALSRHVVPARGDKLGLAWIVVCLSLAVHVADEALTGFLGVFNPTVTAVRRRFGFWPMPTFGFSDWLLGLSIGIALLASLTPFAFRNSRWMRPLIYFCAVLSIGNACVHTVATILGHTVTSVSFARPAPGFYSSPILLAAGVYALLQLRRSRKEK